MFKYSFSLYFAVFTQTKNTLKPNTINVLDAFLFALNTSALSTIASNE